SELSAFEEAVLADMEVAIPASATPTDRLMLIRSLEGLQRRTESRTFEKDLADLCRQAGIDRSPVPEPAAYRFFIALANIEMPPPSYPLAGIEWRFAVKNRLGVWTQYGSLPPCDLSQLEVFELDDVITVGDSGLLWLRGEIEMTTELREAIASLWKVKWEHRNLVRLNEQISGSVRDDVPISEDGIVGESTALREALRSLPFAARSGLPVTIEGETGTGKELVARAIHRRSSRRSRTFTPVNCSAFPENLIESELFGHVRGAFTGADRERIGLIEATDGGTLFLDEIGEMPSPAQAKLLRFLQEGEFRRVGESEIRTADVRIIAATNRMLEKEVDEGRFRQDLYYRIKGIEIALPPLRRRGHDVVLLARKFLADARSSAKTGPSGFTDDVEALLLGYEWEGNVRELQNVVSWAFWLAVDATLVTVDHLPQKVRNSVARASKRGSFYEEIAQFRRHLVEQSLLESGGNQSQAAKNLGMTRQALAYQIRELGVRVRRRK
ncbi:MAG: sigma 54-interacting transcriptional regulator, partial [Thermoanaerobaculia bacterium]|nr:sigma 54-interacting transcriptional regulator [Thermoanaerobaculia bacterium]